MAIETNIRRRTFLGLLPWVIPAATVGAQQVRTNHINPEKGYADPLNHQNHAHLMAAEDPLAAVFSRRVTSLSGFDPVNTLTAFYWGDLVETKNGCTIRSYEITAKDVHLEIAPGIMHEAWTYNGTVPGPTLRCHFGDRLRILFRNRSMSDHTMHFHGVHSGDMDGVLPFVHPGSDFVYEFDAEPPGLHLYHCHVPPVSLHMSKGMFGVFIVDPPKPLRPAKEMVMTLNGWDTNSDQKNEFYAMNGCVNFYRDNPITVARDELVRLYLVNTLEYDPVCSFHIHANFFRRIQFDQDGFGPLEDTVTLSQAERCVLEFSYKHPGMYMFHPHQNLFSERGSMGHFLVT